MDEIEIKVIEINKEEVIQKLKKLGAVFVGEWDVETLIFDDVENNLSKSKELLRLRKKGKYFLTYKGKDEKGFTKKAEELEVEVNNFDIMKKILEKLGFVQKYISSKKRTTYKLKECFIEIDKIKEIPCFLEVEGKSEEEIKEIISLLGLDESKVRNWNGFELFEYYNLH